MARSFILGFLRGLKFPFKLLAGWLRKRRKFKDERREKQTKHVRNFDPNRLKNVSYQKRTERKINKKKKMSKLEFPLEGDIWLVKFDKLKEFSKPFRPCVVVNNNAQNEFDNKIVVSPTTTDEVELTRTFEVFIENTPQNGLEKPSKILCNYPHTIYKKLRLVGAKWKKP